MEQVFVTVLIKSFPVVHFKMTQMLMMGVFMGMVQFTAILKKRQSFFYFLGVGRGLWALRQ